MYPSNEWMGESMVRRWNVSLTSSPTKCARADSTINVAFPSSLLVRGACVKAVFCCGTRFCSQTMRCGYDCFLNWISNVKPPLHVHSYLIFLRTKIRRFASERTGDGERFSPLIMTGSVDQAVCRIVLANWIEVFIFCFSSVAWPSAFRY
jgi:hypothetical protein